MKKLYAKMLLSMFVIGFISVAIPRLILHVLGIDLMAYYTNDKILLLGMIISSSLMLIISNMWFNHMIVKRISKLSNATEKISLGEFNMHLSENGRDEISNLTHHFNVMTDALQKNQYVNQSFMKDYAHEFKTPISIIKGYAELMQKSDSLEDTKQYAKIIENESESLSELAQNILNLSMIENDSIINREDKFNLTEVLRQTISSMQYRWENKNIEFDLSLEEVIIKSNRELLKIMFKNIIDNALKYAVLGSKIKIDVRLSDHIDIIFENETLEMNEEDLSKLFELFYRSESTKHISGHGVGLSIVKKICDVLEFKILLERSEDRKFKLILSKAL